LAAESGAITAESMMALPALVMVFSLMMLGAHASVVSHQLHHQANTTARIASLGGDVEATEEGEWLCVTHTRVLAQGLWKLAPLTLEAHACALNPTVGP
jgi:hypothetical protein